MFLQASASHQACKTESTTRLSASHRAELEPLLLLLLLVAEALTHQPYGAAYLLAVVLHLLLEPALQHMHCNQPDASSIVGLLLKRLLLTTAAQLLLQNFSKPVSKLLWDMCRSLTVLECLGLLCHVLPVFPP
jgi:hypothetical protein